MIITEGTWIDHPGAGHDSHVPRFHGAEALGGWKRVAEAVHAAGGKIFPQLWHVGMHRAPRPGLEQRFPNPETPAFGPSSLPSMDRTVALSLADIESIVEAYASAAVSARMLGFDGIEIHAAHGYLIDQFMRRDTNHRRDIYGMADRTRFAADIIKAIRIGVGARFSISFRFSQWTVKNYDAKLVDTPEELEALLIPLVDAGVDIFHASTRRFSDPAFTGSDLGLAGWTRKITGKVVIAVGSVGIDKPYGSDRSGHYDVHANVDEVNRRIDRNEFDLIAVGRALLANPDWATRIQNDSGPFLNFTPNTSATLF